MGRKIRPGENESAGGLDLGKRVGIRSRAQRALQPAARTELPEHWLHLLHAASAAGRGSTGRALVGLREKGVRIARTGVEVEVGGWKPGTRGWKSEAGNGEERSVSVPCAENWMAADAWLSALGP